MGCALDIPMDVSDFIDLSDDKKYGSVELFHEACDFFSKHSSERIKRRNQGKSVCFYWAFFGRRIINRVPSLILLSTEITPPCSKIIRCTILNPIPVPFALVVK